MKPLASLRVLDLTSGNPYPGSLFADYGAKVIKVEPKGCGDPIRQRGAADGQAESPYASFYMRGKDSIAVDLKTAAGTGIVRRLCRTADMIIFSCAEEHVPSGLSYAELREINPGIIYGVLTPYGENGPWKDMPDYDLLIMSRSGLQEKTGFPEKPTKFGFPLGRIYASWHLTAGMMAAYLSARETGEGAKVSCSTWHTVMELDDTFSECLLGLNTLPKRIGNGFPTTNPTDTFACKDGWFSISVGSDKQWLDFAREAGRDDWGESSIYAHDPDRSMKHYFGDLDEQLRKYFSSITIVEADRICRAAMVPGGPCNTVKELFEDEQVRDRQMLIRVGNEIQFGVPAKFYPEDGTENLIAPAHEVGADTEKILLEAGFTDEELAAWNDAGPGRKEGR